MRFATVHDSLLTGTVDNAIKILTDIRSEIKKDGGSDMIMDTDAYVDVSVEYMSNETDEEESGRLTREALESERIDRVRMSRDAHEEREYKRLKEKYES